MLSNDTAQQPGPLSDNEPQKAYMPAGSGAAPGSACLYSCGRTAPSLNGATPQLPS
jgi:hypothetical protein